MVLLNKTMMCGGLVVLAPGSPLQVFAAILIMQFHLLVVLKTAPYVEDSEDWTAFLSTLGLCLVSLGAYSLMLELKGNELEFIGIITAVLPLLCIVSVLGIMICIDCGVLNALRGKKNKETETVDAVGSGKGSSTDVKKQSKKKLTQVRPIFVPQETEDAANKAWE